MPVNVAFFGAGDLARPYLNALGRRDDVRIVAVCDPDPRTAETVAAGWKAKVFSHYEPMLREAKPDAVWVCVPARLQAEVLQQAANLRIPFFVEPPGAPDYAHARHLAVKVEETQLVTAVGFSARYVDVIREAKEYLGINAIPLAMGWWLTGSPDGAKAQTLLWNEACRLIDLLRYFCGEVTSAGGTASGEDALALTLRLANGTTATLACAAYDVAEPRIELELLGEGWYLRFLDALTTLRLAEREKTTIIRQGNAPHADHTAAFLEAVQTKKPMQTGCTYADACQTMRACQAALEAIKSGGWQEIRSQEPGVRSQ